MSVIPDMSPAHNLWLNATDYSPELRSRAGAHTKVYFGFGHKFPVHDFLDRSTLERIQIDSTRQQEQGS